MLTHRISLYTQRHHRRHSIRFNQFSRSPWGSLLNIHKEGHPAPDEVVSIWRRLLPDTTISFIWAFRLTDLARLLVSEWQLTAVTAVSGLSYQLACQPLSSNSCQQLLLLSSSSLSAEHTLARHRCSHYIWPRWKRTNRSTSSPLIMMELVRLGCRLWEGLAGLTKMSVVGSLNYE